MTNSTYQAIVCEKIGSISSLQLRTLERKLLSNENIRIKVKACGINFPDKLMVEGKYQFKPELPFVPGLEVSGIISETLNIDKKFKVGTKVMCQLRFGGYSEEVIVNKENVYLMPSNFSFEEAACFRVASQTAYVALVERGNICSQDFVLILGAAGGVGLAAVQLANALGAKVIAVSSSQEKQKICEHMGAHYSLSYESLKEKIDDITLGKGIDIIYDPVGGEYFNKALKCIKWGGKYLIIGFAAGNIPSIPINIPLIKGISILGVRAGEYFRRFPEKKSDSIKKLFDIAEKHSIKPYIYSKLNLNEAVKGLKMLEERKVIGRIILSPKDQ